MPPDAVQWWRLPPAASVAGAPPGALPPPLVVLVAWMHAAPRHVASYGALFNRLGCDACAVYPPTLHMWVPSRALCLANALLDALAADAAARGPRPLLLLSFSGGAKACTYRLLQARCCAARARCQLAGRLT